MHGVLRLDSLLIQIKHFCSNGKKNHWLKIQNEGPFVSTFDSEICLLSSAVLITDCTNLTSNGEVNENVKLLLRLTLEFKLCINHLPSFAEICCLGLWYQKNKECGNYAAEVKGN